MEKMNCSHCQHYQLNYGYNVERYYPRNHGVCTYYLDNRLKHCDDICDYFQEKENQQINSMIFNEIAIKELKKAKDIIDHLWQTLQS